MNESRVNFLLRILSGMDATIRACELYDMPRDEAWAKLADLSVLLNDAIKEDEDETA